PAGPEPAGPEPADLDPSGGSAAAPAGSRLRLGVFGGTFDPPHLGHLALAAEACDQLNLARVLWVLTPSPPHKADRPVSPLALRLRLLQAAVQDNPAFELSRVDIDRPPPHYAVDTLRFLRARYPGAALVYLMGGDSLADLPGWHAPGEFLAQADQVGVMCRAGEVIELEALEAQLPGLQAKLRFVDAPMLEIASSDIRRRIRERRSYRYFLSGPVLQLIEQMQLYR
ncbi:MAG: nicotinate-nucleotide adenylyltransferase, partial [Chloroflexota bacterium]